VSAKPVSKPYTLCTGTNGFVDRTDDKLMEISGNIFWHIVDLLLGVMIY